MRTYRFQDIQKITNAGVLFRDGFEFLFEECRNEWCVEHKIKVDQSCYVAERNILAEPPYFMFYVKERVKVLFDKKGILGRKRNEKDFLNLQMILNRIGFSSFDLT